MTYDSHFAKASHKTKTFFISSDFKVKNLVARSAQKKGQSKKRMTWSSPVSGIPRSTTARQPPLSVVAAGVAVDPVRPGPSTLSPLFAGFVAARCAPSALATLPTTVRILGQAKVTGHHHIALIVAQIRQCFAGNKG